MLISLILFLAACGEIDNPANPADGGTTDGGADDSGTWDGGTGDGGTDTGTEPMGGNCGGPEPPLDSLWECEGMGDGPPWSAAGAPIDFENCLTVSGWQYEISEDGRAVALIRDTDGKEFFCEWDGESYLD